MYKYGMFFMILVSAFLLMACGDESDEKCKTDDDCKAGGFGWVCDEGVCVKEEDGDSDGDIEAVDVVPCTEIGNKTDCEVDPMRCTWEDDRCKYAPPIVTDGDSGNGDGGGGCYGLDFEQCRASSPYCVWQNSFCIEGDPVNPDDCSKYRTEAECARGYGCQWANYRCVSIW